MYEHCCTATWTKDGCHWAVVLGEGGDENVPIAGPVQCNIRW